MLRQAHPALMKLAVCELPTSASRDRNVRVSTLGGPQAAKGRARHDLQHDLGRPRGIYENRVRRHHATARRALCFAALGIDVELREVRAGDVEADAMALPEKVRGGERLDRDRVDLPRLHRRRPLPGVAIT